MKPAHAHDATGDSHDPAAKIRALTPGESQRLLDQKFHALNQLSGGIAHEFNNIIAGILGSAELIAMDLPEGHPTHESLKQIFEASNRARDFLHKVRAFSQRQPVERKPATLPPVIEASIQILRGIIPDKVELRADIALGSPEVNLDAAQIQQVMLDLCLYCWQGLHERSGLITLSLTASPQKLPATLPPGNYVHLAIQDDSQGLDQPALKKIFDPFHARRSTKRIGLELFLARETIRAHQGELIAGSEPGHGLAFHIFLPALSPG